VLRPWGSLYYLASVDEIHHLVRSGVAKAFGPRRRLDGCVLFAGPTRPHAGTRYVHNHEVSESWTDPSGVVHMRNQFDANVRGCYTLKRLSGIDQDLFKGVQISCTVG